VRHRDVVTPGEPAPHYPDRAAALPEDNAPKSSASARGIVLAPALRWTPSEDPIIGYLDVPKVLHGVLEED
jgi:hypothetical protein